MSLTYHTLILKNDGTLWGCGADDCGQLGFEDMRNRTSFAEITTNANDVKSVYCGRDHSFILKNDGTLWGCGMNSSGQLGLGNTNEIHKFTQITTNTDNIKSVYCGEYYTIILKNDGTIWGCGHNQYGQLGLGDTSYRYTFTKITTNADNVKSVSCGANHTLILKNDGTLWSCGYGGNGRLGLGDENSRTTFTIINSNPGNIKSICCGTYHTLILKNDDTLWGCGSNGSGQLGLGSTNSSNVFTKITNNVKLADCGYEHTVILKNDGTLWGCGTNDSGQLGLGDESSRKTFTIIGINTNYIKSIYCGIYYTFILKNDGTLWSCGNNNYSQLGLGDSTRRKTFTKLTTNANNVKCFANDYNTQSIIKIYDTKVGYVETLDTNNFRNISVNTVEKLKSLCVNPLDTHLNCLISFDKKQTWKTFDGLNWNTISDISPENIILNCMSVGALNQLDKSKLISGGFTGDLDFKIAMKTSDVNKTPSVTKIYIEYK